MKPRNIVQVLDYRNNSIFRCNMHLSDRRDEVVWRVVDTLQNTYDGMIVTNNSNVLNREYAVSGAYDLHVLDVRYDDAGTYECGNRVNPISYKAELVVLGKHWSSCCSY